MCGRIRRRPISAKASTDCKALVAAQLHRDPLSGDCYLFVNRTRRRAKVLLWDGTGLCIYQKRLEQGRFAALWAQAGAPAVELTLSELALLLEGCALLAQGRFSPTVVTPRALPAHR